MEGMVKIRINDQMRIRTTKYNDTFSKSGGFSIREKATWIGWLGRVVVQDFMEKFGAEVKFKRYDGDIFITIDGKYFQVKTSTRRSMKDPQPNWSAVVDLHNWEKLKDHNSQLFFAYYYEEIGVIWLAGMIKRSDFNHIGKVYEKGDKFEQLRVVHPMKAVKIKDLYPFNKWLIENNYKLSIKNMDQIKKGIVEIIKRYKRKIYQKNGDIEEYTVTKTLGQPPSEYANRAQHLKVAQQYANLVRKETKQPDLLDDEITPAGTITTYVKTNRHPDGVLLDQIAEMEDIDSDQYIDDLDNMISQIINPFGLTRQDTLVDYDPTIGFKKQLKLDSLIG